MTDTAPWPPERTAGGSPPSAGVLLMAYGSAESLDELDAFYTHIRGGRRPSEAALADLRRRYAAIGGRSPLRDITERQRAAVAAELARRGHAVPVFAAMKHAEPFIGAVVAQIARSGVSRIVGLALAPHFSGMSVGAYREQLDAAVRDQPTRFEAEMVESWHLEPRLTAAVARVVAEAFGTVGDNAHLVFTAHSLPERILESGDPYPAQLLESAERVARELELARGRWSFAYQSAGRTGEPWLGPDLGDHLAYLAEEGVREVVVCPIGFVADHLEILYDLDIEAQARAAELGLRLARTRSMNDDPTFAAAIADVVERRLSPHHEDPAR